MAFRQGILAALGAAGLMLSACAAPEQPILMHAAAQERGPDEFAILPTRPLEMPTSLTALPPPQPGGVNRVDPRPEDDVVLALGGNPAAARGPESGIVGYASRLGRDPNIRAQLAAEDLAFRQRNQGRLLERLFAVNVYHQAYEFMWLDKYAELERWRRAGVQTPTAPPRPRR
ncbi:MAG: DUF3035 domain-containing protein [Roseinatronobacter sp.]